MKTKTILLVQVFILIAFCQAAWSQTIKDIPESGRTGAAEKSLQPRPIQQPTRLPEIIIQEDGTPRLGDGKVKFLLKELLFDDNLVFSREQLRTVVAEHTGKTIEVGKLSEIADAITAYYQKAGYFLTRAYVPPQAIRDGKVTIKVREGRLGDIIINGNQRYSRDLIRNTLKIIRGEGAVRTADVERALLLLMDYPGLKVKATFKPGSLPATTDIVLDVTEDRFFSFGVDYNNFGSRYVSQDRFGLSFDLYNPMSVGDAFSLRATTGAEGAQSLFYGRLEYVLPVSRTGSKLGINYSSMQYDLIGDLKALKAGGESKGGGIWFSHPIVRGRNFNWFWQAGFDTKDVSQNIQSLEVGRDKTRHAYLGTSFHWVDALQGSNSVSVKGYQSFAKLLGGLDQNDTRTIRSGTEVIYSKVELDASRIQQLPLGASMLLNVSSQWSGHRLPSSEQFYLGGAGTVRGYVQGERSGDSGLAATAELRIPIPGVSDVRWWSGSKTVGETLQLAAFYDYGKAWISDATLWGEQALDDSLLQGAGVGLRFTYSPYVRFKVDWAKTVGGLVPAKRDDKDNGVWYLQAAISF